MVESTKYVTDYNTMIDEETGMRGVQANLGQLGGLFLSSTSVIAPTQHIIGSIMSGGSLNMLGGVVAGRMAGSVASLFSESAVLPVGMIATGLSIWDKTPDKIMNNIKESIIKSIDDGGLEGAGINVGHMNSSFSKTSMLFKTAGIISAIPTFFKLIKQGGEAWTSYNQNNRNSPSPSGSEYYDSLRGGNQMISAEHMNSNTAFARALQDQLKAISQPAREQYNAYARSLTVRQ